MQLDKLAIGLSMDAPLSRSNSGSAQSVKSSADQCKSKRWQNLQEERITPAAPFTYSGMDAFGPLLGNGLRDCHAVKLNFVPFVLVT